MQNRLHKTPEEVLSLAKDLLEYAKSLTPKVQFTIEDASRAEEEYLLRLVRQAANGGASIINISDTVGTAIPEEFGVKIHRIREELDQITLRYY